MNRSRLHLIGLTSIAMLLCPAIQAQTTAPASRQQAIACLRAQLDPEDITWLKQATQKQLDGCRFQAHDGTILFAPDGSGNYRALWTRDFQYMVCCAGNLLDPKEIRAAITYLLKGQRADGCMPDRVRADGTAVYSPGPPASPLAGCALDNGPFMAELVADYVRLTGDLAFFARNESALRRGLDFVPRAVNGLVYNDPAKPQCPYGFTDTVAKTGHLLFTSLLYYDACRQMASLTKRCGVGDSRTYTQRADLIRKSISILWDEKSGMFLAADRDCRQIDVWGSALTANLGVATPDQCQRIVEWLVRNEQRVFKRGQVRHLPYPQTWSRMLLSVKPGEYQNGAYWAVPHAWLLPVLAQYSPQLSIRLARETLHDFRIHGINECVNENYAKVPDYVTSATSLYSVFNSSAAEY
jgi:hypothetical protein